MMKTNGWMISYSGAAKELLKTYDLKPPPKIVEVDMRGKVLRLFDFSKIVQFS